MPDTAKAVSVDIAVHVDMPSETAEWCPPAPAAEEALHLVPLLSRPREGGAIDDPYRFRKNWCG